MYIIAISTIIDILYSNVVDIGERVNFEVTNSVNKVMVHFGDNQNMINVDLEVVVDETNIGEITKCTVVDVDNENCILQCK